MKHLPPRLTFDPATASFALVAPAKERPFAVGRFAIGGGTSRTVVVPDPAFGEGQGFEITAADGSTARVVTYPNLPFVLCRVRRANPAAEPAILNRVPVARFELDLDAPADDLRAMGTGGPAPVAGHPGSYVWLAVVEPRSRAGVVGGWLTHDRASGVIFPTRDGERVTLEARNDFGRLRIAPGTSADTETFAIGRFDDARLGLEAFADAVAKHYRIMLPRQPVGYCTWYSDKNGLASNEAAIDELGAFAERNLVPYGFDFVQIDDHWQQGTRPAAGQKTPKKDFTAADPAGPYPSGMRPTADKLKARGLTPGIWFMPFSGTAGDPFFADKQAIFLKDDKGERYDARWGGLSLDMTKLAAQQYVRAYVTRLVKEWGYTYFKMDGLYAGIGARQNYINSGYKEDGFGDADFADPDKTNVEAYRDGLRLLRDAAGPGVFFLGCSISQNMRTFGASFGLVDAMRVGPDNAGTWKEWLRSPKVASWNYFLNGRVWYNDPDPFYVRAAEITTLLEQPNAPATQQKKDPLPRITDAEARTIATWHAISGALMTNSDWLPGLPAGRLEILRRAIPSHGKAARPVDYFERDVPRLWAVTDGDRHIVAAFNWGDDPLMVDEPLARCGLPPVASYAAFDFWGDRFVALGDRLQAVVPPHGCLVLSVRPASATPSFISTSRHVTQGIIDVADERWDEATQTLSGASAVVGGDSYELRVAAGGRQPRRAAVSDADDAAGVSIDLQLPDGGGFRVRIRSAGSRTVRWRVSF